MEGPTLEYSANYSRVRDLLSQGVRGLAAAGIDQARLDAEVLLGHVLAMTHEQLIVAADLPLSAEQVQRFAALWQRRLSREPVAYITGKQEFWSLDFHVTRDVLIPRPETERLIEVALTLAAELGSDKPLRVLEIGTGSGAIAVSLATELPSAEIIATDISTVALEVAQGNAMLHGAAGRITFLPGDLFAALGGDIAAFDLIVSNPPYIRRAQIATLEPEVSRWEPRGALDGGADGLDFYRRIAAQAWQFLTLNGALTLEIGADMGGEVSSVFNRAGFYREVAVFHDYAGCDRVIGAKVATNSVGSI
ncbi:MAG: protein-(glutamine-N5) methyltransferase, release factor-specific [Deltaproteobacteria bacterium]|nr:protein-(glutamine-N5) methyltransferase, release factor-specific [Deltaproteobacteria bacterium]